MNFIKTLRLNAASATTTVLILGSLATIVASLMLFQSTDNAVASKVIRDGKRAEYAAMACAEVALGKLRTSATYTGNETITVAVTAAGTISCQIGVVTTAGATYSIPTTATVGVATKRLQIDISSRGTKLNISAWKEITGGVGAPINPSPFQ